MLRALLGAGDHIVIPNDAYGGTFRLVSKVLGADGRRAGARPRSRSPDALRDAWTEATKVVWVETPTNPALGIVDIAAVAAVVHELGAVLVVDNTFATPYLQRPLELGADVVVHSTTKYLGGHSDVVGGFVAVVDDELGERIAFLQNAAGGVSEPVRLLPRAARDQDARRPHGPALRQRARRRRDARRAPAVDRVLYPGLPSHPGPRGRGAADAGFGGMVSFLAAGGEDAALELVAAHPGVHARRVAGCGRVAHRAPGPDDPRLGRRAPRSPSTRRWSASRSASRPSPTSSPTSTRPCRPDLPRQRRASRRAGVPLR